MRVGWLNLQNAFWQNDCLFWFALRYIKVYDYDYIHSTDTRIINENSVDECKSYDTSVRPAVSVSLLVFPFAARPKTMQTCSENKNMNNWHSAAVWGDVLLVTNEEQPKLSRAFIYTSVRKVECNRMILQGHFSVSFSFCFLIWVRPKISIRIRIRYRILILQGHSTDKWDCSKFDRCYFRKSHVLVTKLALTLTDVHATSTSYVKTSNYVRLNLIVTNFETSNC